MRTATLKIGENKGHCRIWIEGKYLADAGFCAGEGVDVDYGDGRVQITPGSDRNLCGKSRKAGRYPVIDLNNERITRIFSTFESAKVQVKRGLITITPALRDIRRKARRKDGTAGSIFSGGGLLDEAARQAGYRTLFGVEWNPDYADIWQSNHSGRLYEGCISQVDFDELPQVDLFIGGIPCEPFSLIRRHKANVKRDRDELPENHDLGDMSIWALMFIEACNPRVVVLEETAAYINSGIGIATIKALRRMGYNVDHRIIDGTEYGAVTTRQRCVIVGTDGPINWPEPRPHTRTVGEILLPPDHPECEWFNRDTKSWLFEHWEKQSEKGNSFASQQLTAETPSVQAITKRYFAQQGDNPVVKHPDREGWFRWLTLREVKRIMGLPETYDVGPTLTTAGEVLGQGVLVDVFRQIISSVAE